MCASKAQSIQASAKGAAPADYLLVAVGEDFSISGAAGYCSDFPFDCERLVVQEVGRSYMDRLPPPYLVRACFPATSRSILLSDELMQ